MVEGLLPVGWIGELKEPLEVESKFFEVILYPYWGVKVVRLK